MNLNDIYRLMRIGHIQAQGIVDTAPDPMLVLDESLRVQAASRAFCQFFRVDRDDVIGQYVYDLGAGEWDISALRLLLKDVIPKANAIIDYEVEAEFPAIGKRIILLTARRLHHPDDVSHSMLLSMVDVTERRSREAQKEIVSGELRHRIKNLLAVTGAIARHTPVEGRTAEEYRDAFLGRFAALIDAEDLAFSESEHATLASLVERVLAPFGSDTGAILVERGPAIMLPARSVTALALLLHELSTNAVKHGALSQAGGQVLLGWNVDDATESLVLNWKEKGGPVVSEPIVTSYGSELIHSAVTYSLGGQMEQKFDPEGLTLRITVPKASLGVAD